MRPCAPPPAAPPAATSSHVEPGISHTLRAHDSPPPVMSAFAPLLCRCRDGSTLILSRAHSSHLRVALPHHTLSVSLHRRLLHHCRIRAARTRHDPQPHPISHHRSPLNASLSLSSQVLRNQTQTVQGNHAEYRRVFRAKLGGRPASGSAKARGDADEGYAANVQWAGRAMLWRVRQWVPEQGALRAGREMHKYVRREVHQAFWSRGAALRGANHARASSAARHGRRLGQLISYARGHRPLLTGLRQAHSTWLAFFSLVVSRGCQKPRACNHHVPANGFLGPETGRPRSGKTACVTPKQDFVVRPAFAERLLRSFVTFFGLQPW